MNRAGEAILITTGRRLARDGVPDAVDNVVVMLDAHDAWRELGDDYDVWWSAFTGMAGERSVAGRLTEQRDVIDRERDECSRRTRLAVRHVSVPTPPMKVLLLAGTTEARELADDRQRDRPVEMVASFAGHTRTPARDAVRGPSRRIRRHRRTGVVRARARHRRDRRRDPSVLRPTCRAMRSCRCATPRDRRTARLVRPPWTPTSGDDWIDADDLADAARVVGRLGRSPVLLTIGRHELASFAGLEPVAFVVRTVEDPQPVPFRPSAIVQGRGPFSVDDEEALLSEHGIELLVTKNAGGDDAKLVAARSRTDPGRDGAPPGGRPGEQCFTNAADTLAWLESLKR